MVDFGHVCGGAGTYCFGVSPLQTKGARTKISFNNFLSKTLLFILVSPIKNPLKTSFVFTTLYFDHNLTKHDAILPKVG